MDSVNESRGYYVKPSLIGRAHTLIDPCYFVILGGLVGFRLLSKTKHMIQQSVNRELLGCRCTVQM